MDDVDRLVEIHTQTFPDPRGYEERRRNFINKKPCFVFDDLCVVEAQGSIVAHAFASMSELFVGGRPVPTGLVASVGVAPEVRGQGVATFLIDAVHAHFYERGAVAALLYPFRYRFYERFAYGATSPYVQLHLTPRALLVQPPKVAGVRPLQRADFDAIATVDVARAHQATGFLRRDGAWWEQQALTERSVCLVHEHDGMLDGYVVWQLSQREAHAETTLVVRDFAALNELARHALWGAIALQRDQVTTIEWNVSLSDPVLTAALDLDESRFGTLALEHPMGTLAAGPSVKLMDTRAALSSRGYEGDGVMVVGIETPQGMERWCVTVRDRRASVTPTSETAMLTGSRMAMARLFLGGVPVRSLWQAGGLRVASEEVVRQVQTILGDSPFFSPDPF